MAVNKSEFVEVIHASKEKVWQVLFSEYGDIHVHNPTMHASNYMNGAERGELGCVRHTEFGDKLFLDEKIAEFEEHQSVTMEATEHNLPFMRKMSATYELSDLGDGKTELKMTSYASTSPGFMIYLMRGRLGAALRKHLFGMRYYIETGKTVSMAEYDEVHARYA
ncbi:MAG: SRPBCC family protein [Myxococcota bacterium]